MNPYRLKLVQKLVKAVVRTRLDGHSILDYVPQGSSRFHRSIPGTDAAGTATNASAMLSARRL